MMLYAKKLRSQSQHEFVYFYIAFLSHKKVAQFMKEHNKTEYKYCYNDLHFSISSINRMVSSSVFKISSTVGSSI